MKISKKIYKKKHKKNLAQIIHKKIMKLGMKEEWQMNVLIEKQLWMEIMPDDDGDDFGMEAEGDDAYF